MISVTGLGPGDFDRLPVHVKSLLTDELAVVVCRTIEHPAARTLADIRDDVVFCDDLYEDKASFDEVYAAIVERVIDLAESGNVIYAVPGSPVVGEVSVRALLDSGRPVELVRTESFVDAVLETVGYDPLDRGLQILNAHALPDPLVLDKPTIVAQVDRPELAAEAGSLIGRVVDADDRIVVLRDLGTPEAAVLEYPVDGLDPAVAGLRTTLFIDPTPSGLVGVVATMRRLRHECPWDREQSHSSLVKNLVEEVYELIEAIGRLPDDEVDWVAYSTVEDELGDVLLQVLFHSAIAREAGAFDIDDVSNRLRTKLIRRHPHVFGDVDVEGAAEVKENWDRIKQAERGESGESALDGIPGGMPAMHKAAKIQNRAAKVGFDWDTADEVVVKVREELEETRQVLDDPARSADELGDLLFSVVNLARHLRVDPELALSAAIDRFDGRFRRMEEGGSLDGLTLEELDARWEQAKATE